ncbi:hypothetical protein AKJ16_DCAP16268 [Drosera capensis]
MSLCGGSMKEDELFACHATCMNLQVRQFVVELAIKYQAPSSKLSILTKSQTERLLQSHIPKECVWAAASLRVIRLPLRGFIFDKSLPVMWIPVLCFVLLFSTSVEKSESDADPKFFAYLPKSEGKVHINVSQLEVDLQPCVLKAFYPKYSSDGSLLQARKGIRCCISVPAANSDAVRAVSSDSLLAYWGDTVDLFDLQSSRFSSSSLIERWKSVKPRVAPISELCRIGT